MSVDINSIIKYAQRIKFDDNRLFIRRTLPETCLTYERFMSSNQLIVSLDEFDDSKQLNQKNLPIYFRKYGTIVLCHTIIPGRTFLLGFIEANSVDCAIIDGPHSHDTCKLILRKFISPVNIDRFCLYDVVYNRVNKRNISSIANVHRIKHITEAAEFAYYIQLNLIKCFYEEKQNVYNNEENDKRIKLTLQSRENCDEMNKQIEQMKRRNASSKIMIEQTQRLQKHIKNMYETKIQNEQNRIQKIMETIDSLIFH